MIGSLSRTSQLFFILTIVLRVKSENGWVSLSGEKLRVWHSQVRKRPRLQYGTLSLQFPLKSA